MACTLWRTWAVAVLCIEVFLMGSGFDYEKKSIFSQLNYGNDIKNDDYSSSKIVRPVSYTYFSSNLRDSLNSRVDEELPIGIQQIYGLSFREKIKSKVIPDEHFRILTDNLRQQSYVAPYQEKSIPAVSRRTVKFPLNTVLPANSLSFDHKPYPGLLQAVHTFSDLTPSRKPNDGILVTHNTVSLPVTNEGITTASKTTITNQGISREDGNYPYSEFTETTHNTQGDRGSVIERTQRLRFHQGIDEDPAESYTHSNIGHDGIRYESEEIKEGDHHIAKGGKGEKEYKKKYNFHKESKGYRDKERDLNKLEENLKKEKKFHKDEEFTGEQSKTKNEGQRQKYGGGGKRKKGHTTHGEHNILKKDEFIKNTKFYDEDHGGGEHEEHIEKYGQQEEKNERKEKGRIKENKYEKKEEERTKSRDKEQEEEKHKSRNTDSGREHFEKENEYEGKKEGHNFKKWRNRIGDHN